MERKWLCEGEAGREMKAGADWSASSTRSLLGFADNIRQPRLFPVPQFYIQA